MASLQSTYPTILNGVEYAPFKVWNIKFNDNVTTHETEGGTQEDSVTRRGRRSISCSTTCVESLATQLACLEDLDSFTAKFFNIKTGAYVETTVRVAAGSMSVSLLDKSAKLDYCNGIYQVSFTLEEF